MPRHPAVAWTATLSAVFVLPLLLGVWLTGFSLLLLPFLVAAVGIAVLAIHAKRTALPVQHNNSAFNALSAGRLEDAEAHLVEAERSSVRALRITTNFIRAQLYLQRAELDLARKHLDAVLATPLPWLGRTHSRLAVVSARGLRAFVCALSGDQAATEADLEALRMSSAQRVDALSWAELARAVLLHKAGDARALRDHLDRNRNLLFEFTRPRERALVRALRWSAHQPNLAYRTASRREREASQGLHAWLESVLPGAGELAEEPPEALEADNSPEAVAGRASVAAPPSLGQARELGRPHPPVMTVAMPARRGWTTGRAFAAKTLVLWVVLIVAFLAIWQFLSPDGPPAAAPVAESQFSIPWTFMLAPAALFAAIFGGLLWRGHSAQQTLIRAGTLIASDPSRAHDELLRLSGSSLKAVSAQAHLMLAGLAERAADYKAALAHADSALAQLREPGMRALTYDLLLPEIHAARALALGGLDRMSEASVELAAIEHDFPAYYLLERSRFRVLQLLAVRSGDYQGAAELSKARTADLPISYRDDVLGEIAEVVARGAAVGRTRLARLRSEIDLDPTLAHWLDASAPQLMVRFSDLRAA